MKTPETVFSYETLLNRSVSNNHASLQPSDGSPFRSGFQTETSMISESKSKLAPNTDIIKQLEYQWVHATASSANLAGTGTDTSLTLPSQSLSPDYMMEEIKTLRSDI